MVVACLLCHMTLQAMDDELRDKVTVRPMSISNRKEISVGVFEYLYQILILVWLMRVIRIVSLPCPVAPSYSFILFTL